MTRTDLPGFHGKRVLCFLVILLFCLSLIPLLLVAQYDLPVGDDIQFGEETTTAWNETGELGAVFQAAGERTRWNYQNWQGTYFSIFLMCFQPAVFSLSLYSLTPWIMLFLFIASSLFAGYVVLIRHLKLDVTEWLLIVFSALLFQIQLLPDIKEGFFWYNSAVLYTVSYCFALFMFGLLALSHLVKSRLSRITSAIAAALFAAAVSGGAFSLLLPAFFIIACMLFHDIVRRNKRGIFSTGLVLVVLMIGSAVNLSAPGNAIRVTFEHNYYGSHGLSALEAIVQSVINGVLFTARFTDFAMIVFPGLWIASFYRLLHETKIKFYHPAIVFILTFGLVCMQFTPTLYTLASIGPGRILNVVFFSLYWFWAVNIFNLVGWIKQKRIAPLRFSLASGYSEKTEWNLTTLGRRVVLTLAVFLAFCAFIQRDGGLFANPSVQAVSEIHNGISKEHYEQRLAELQGGAVTQEQTASAILP